MKKPEDFNFTTWMEKANEIINAPIKVPDNWLTRNQFANKLGLSTTQADRKVTLLVEAGLMLKHRVGKKMYLEPVQPIR